MTLFGGLVVFVLVWWGVFFAVLPWGVRRQENVEPGHEPGAPARPLLWRKAAVTTAIAIVVTAAIWALAEADLISFQP